MKLRTLTIIGLSVAAISAAVVIPLTGLESGGVLYADGFDGPTADDYGGVVNDDPTKDDTDTSDTSDTDETDNDQTTEEDYFKSQDGVKGDDMDGGTETDYYQEINDQYEKSLEEDICLTKTTAEDGTVSWETNWECETQKIKEMSEDEDLKESARKYWQGFIDNIGSISGTIIGWFSSWFDGFH